MDTLEALGARIETTDEIRDIVRTMKALSAVSIRQYERAAAAMHEYQRTVELGLRVVLGSASAPVPGAPLPPGRRAAVVIGSDRGLCGRFNEAVANFADRDIDARGHRREARPLLLAVGVRVADRLAGLGRVPDTVDMLPGSADGLVRMAQAILIQLEDWRTHEGVTAIRVYFNRRTPEARARPGSRAVAPLSAAYLSRLAAGTWPARGLPMFTMPGDQLFAALARQLMYAGIYRAGADSLACEHATRLAAMQAAERNIDERLSDLGATYRKMRQDAITTELLDLVAGFEAARG
ncbi:MAG: F0F1 ATP synthase subunit gamma [Alphaproteobacteria bacterium]|nr:F0F1 ATP synthase subunit gamma [Alphaproteobacteria bacterium]MDX5370086.1 F0F1 ATP synthase subunit gamma [Alphaproteobacteria bacterium]MDX5464663.1 F0F1 ATP synthase subunit gamma [Alphaproteobacteria bacterium]